MAQKKKATKKTTKSTTTKKASTKSKPSAPPEPVVPIRRELGGVLFFFLAVFVGVSYFRNEGAFIQFFSNLVRGLVGWGYWLTVPAFLLISFILFFHRGRPVSFRVFCTLLIPILTAAIISLIVYKADLSGMDIKDQSEVLFAEGRELKSGGVLGGLLAVGLKEAFTPYGALPVLAVLLIFCVIFAFDGGFRKTARKVKSQMQAEYDPSMYESNLKPLSSLSGDIPFGQEPMKIERISRQNYGIDIPLGEDDDALSLFQGVSDTKVSVTPTSRGRRKSKSAAVPVETATEGVMPLSAEEAAKIAGIDLMAFDAAKEEAKAEKKGREKTVVRPTPKTVTVSAGFSDPPKIQKINRDDVAAEAQAVAEQINASEDKPDYAFPPVSLLRSGVAAAGDARDEILLNKERLEGAIHSFGIGARIVGVTNTRMLVRCSTSESQRKSQPSSGIDPSRGTRFSTVVMSERVRPEMTIVSPSRAVCTVFTVRFAIVGA